MMSAPPHWTCQAVKTEQSDFYLSWGQRGNMANRSIQDSINTQYIRQKKYGFVSVALHINVSQNTTWNAAYEEQQLRLLVAYGTIADLEQN